MNEFLDKIMSFQFAGIPLITMVLSYIAIKITKTIIRVAVIVIVAILLTIWWQNSFEGFPDFASFVEFVNTNWVK